jgi:hypothetical protein
VIEPLSVLFGALWTAATAWALGRLLLARLRLPLFAAEQHLLAWLTGTALLSLLLFLLGFVHGYYDAVFLLVGAASLAALWPSGAWRASGAQLPPLPRAWRILFLAGFAVFAVIYVLHAMGPETSPDGSSYHLGTVSRWYREHRMLRLPHHMYAHLSMGVDLLFLYAFAFGRHSSAALTHATFLLALPWLMLCFGRRFGVGRAAVAGALLAFGSPLLGVDGSSAYVDVAVAVILFGVFYLLEVWRQSGDHRLLVPLGLLAGFAYAAKYTAFLAVVYAGLAVLLRLWRLRQAWLKPAAVFAACAGLLILPWMVRNYAWFGNPFSPMLNRYFPNPYIHVSFEQDYSEHMRHYEGLASYWDIPLEVTVRGGILTGFLGPAFLAAPLLLLGLGNPFGRRLALAALVFALPYAANIGSRFLIPAVPFAAFGLALGLARWPWLALALALAHLAAGLPPVASRYCDPYAWRIGRVGWREALRLEKLDDWMRRKWPPWLVARMVERFVPPGGVVFSFNGIPDAYTGREIRVDYQGAGNQVLRDLLIAPLAYDMQCSQSYVFPFASQPLRRIRVVQLGGPGVPDLWSVHELRVFDGARELERATAWRLTANPNPYEIQRAFDGSRHTRWRSYERIRPGMFVEVDFGAPTRSDRATVEYSTDQYAVKLRLDGQTPAGNWITLNREPLELGVRPPLEQRRAATEELKRAGITHLLVDDHDFTGPDMRRQPALWGVFELQSAGGMRLYRIK